MILPRDVDIVNVSIETTVKCFIIHMGKSFTSMNLFEKLLWIDTFLLYANTSPAIDLLISDAPRYSGKKCH